MINFEWDELKAAINFAKHGVTFADASVVFNDPFALDVEERSMDYGEIRRRIIALGNGRPVFDSDLYRARRDNSYYLCAKIHPR